ncbi:MAG: PKD domain-containing protein [Methanomicrobiales archaeon]|nr:PKD domain-containing protein [Methanomicrobiales archaeon]
MNSCVIPVNNEPLPGVVIAAFSATHINGNSVHFKDESWGRSEMWKWDFGDGTSGSGNSVDHTYSNPGMYTVSLWARNNLSQSQVVKGDITVPVNGKLGNSLFFGP